MNRWIAIVLLSIFTTCNLVINYGGYKKGMEVSVAMLEEDESHLEVLEVKKYIKSDIHPFEAFEEILYKPTVFSTVPVKTYEDVYLSSVETPPDFVC